MSKTEDYLDSLLNAVSEGSAGRVTKKDTRSGNRNSNQSRRENKRSRRESSELDKRFIEDFENELLDENDDEADEFLKEYEMELSGERSSDDSGDAVEAITNEVLPAEATPAEAIPADNISTDDVSMDDSATDDNLTEDAASAEAADMQQDSSSVDDLLSEAMNLLGDEADDVSQNTEVSEESDENLSAGIENEAETTDMPEIIDESAPVENADDLSDMLNVEGGEFGDIGDLLDAVDGGDMIEDPSNLGLDDFGGTAMTLDPSEAENLIPEAGSEDGDAGKKSKGKKDKKAKKEKKDGEGFFAKLTKILFGEDEEETADAAAIAQENGLEGLTDENLAILAGADEEDAKGKKAKKKKEKKPKEKKPKAKPKKEEKPPKEKKVKPKKEKKPVDPSKLDLTPPLPLAPVILIFVMGISMIVLVVLATNLLDSSSSKSIASGNYRKGDYVAAYEALNGKTLSGDLETIYTKAELLARVQSKLEDYDSLMYAKQYDMAIDSLICCVGRYYANYDEAVTAEITTEYSSLRDDYLLVLDEIGITEDEAKALYDTRDRKEYTKAILAIVSDLGYETENDSNTGL